MLYIINYEQERSSAKRKELYKTVQTKAGVSLPTQLLIDMKVRWSSMYIMLNRADTNKEVCIRYRRILRFIISYFNYSTLTHLYTRWVGKSVI
jgi:hypothetical protein